MHEPWDVAVCRGKCPSEKYDGRAAGSGGEFQQPAEPVTTWTFRDPHHLSKLLSMSIWRASGITISGG
jgi:hypothetical protein